jgi:hypothetical protein
MKIMWNQEKVSVHKKLHQMITATLKWTQLTDVFNGKNKTKQDKVKKIYTYSWQMAKHSEKIIWGYWPSKECNYALQSMKLSHYR